MNSFSEQENKNSGHMAPPAKKILVLWADANSANLGVRVLAEGMRHLAMKVWDIPYSSVFFQDFAANKNGFSLGKSTALADLGKKDGPVKNFLSKFDTVIDSGAGDSFADIYGLRRLLMMHYVQRTAVKMGKSYFKGPQTIGPFNSSFGKLLGRTSLKSASFVVARDQESASFAQALGAPVNLVATDVVFLLDRPAPRKKVRDVILNVSGLLWQTNPHVDYTRYQEETLELIGMLRSSGRSVSILAHVLDNESRDNDLVALRDLESKFGDDLDYCVPTDLQSAREIISSGEVLVGARMHACLNALSVGVPAVPWAYSRKFSPLMSSLGWNYSIDIRTDINPAGRTMAMIIELSASPKATHERVELVNRTAMDSLDEMVLAIRGSWGKL